MRKILLLLISVFTLPCWAAVNVPLTLQEAIYSGSVAGVNRTSDPVTVGVPLPDDPANGITNVNELTLSGARIGQFRVLGRWPSGRIKWVLVDTQATLSVGSSAIVTMTNGGSGNFGGASLATDNGATITVATGSATFTIRKANFNVFEQVLVGTRVLVSAGSSRGLVLTGPTPGQTACPPCTTLYSSSNDPNSTAIIEENGPAKTVIKATGNHVDTSGNVYMHFTLRMYFYRGKSFVKLTSVLRNASYGTSNSFATAYKGLQAYEVRLTPNIAGTLNYTIATHATPQTGTLSGEDSVYIYQGQSEFMCDGNCPFGSSCANSYTRDTGYSVMKSGAAVASGNSRQYHTGWADIRDATGAGVQVGIYQMATQWPSSLEFNAGGTDVRIGIFARQNTQPVYQAWPAWSIHDLFVNFHDAAQSATESEFLKFQHYLIGRPSIGHINGTNVFPYPIIQGSVEDNYLRNLASTSNPQFGLSFYCWGGRTPCTPDRGVGDANAIVWGLGITAYREYGWGAGGPSNQMEARWSDLMKFYQLGFTGRFVNSAHFYRFLAEKAWPHADGNSSVDSTVNGFTWRSRPPATVFGAELNGFGRPNALSANSDKSFVSWMDALHFHWHGITDYYFMTGDETIREAIVPMKDWYLNNETYQGGKQGGIGYTRAVGIELMSASRFAEYLQAVGDPAYTEVLEQATLNFNLFVKPDVCVNGQPSGCTPPSLTNGSGSDPQGVSRARGVPIQAQMRASWCNTGFYRIQSYFQPAILVEGLLFLRRAKGTAWADHTLALDLAYGISQWALNEAFGDDGTSNWMGTNQLNNGFRYGQRLDIPEVCPDGTTLTGNLVQVNGRIFDQQSTVVAGQTVWPYFYVQHLMTGRTDWERKFAFQINRVAYSQGSWPADFGGYSLGSVLGVLNNPGSASLIDVPFTVASNGAGSYTISWTVPAGAQSYRIKWSPKIIAPSNGLLGFSPLLTNTFALDPDVYSTWFGANDVAEPPAAASGTTQTFTIVTGIDGLGTPNFSVKAYVQGDSGRVPTRMELFSGNGQTGSVGTQLTNPFVVKVTDSIGNPVSGVNVTFTVTAGGGSLTATQAATDAQGLAASTLILGATSGLNTVTAASGNLTGSPVTFTATAVSTTPPPTNLVIISGDGQTGLVGNQLASPFVVKVTDAGNNPVSGVNVAFTVTAGGGSLSTAQMATNTLGLASTTLTLGPAAGTNTVLATSAGLAGSPAAFNAVAASGQADITWTLMSRSPDWPGYNGWLTIWYDPLSRQTILYGIRAGSSSIYSTDLFSYKSDTNTWTHLGGTGSMFSTCPADTPDWPGNRHPGWQMAPDSKRNVIWMYGGPNQTCDGGYVVTDGTAVTMTTGNWFDAGGTWNGNRISINGVIYAIASVIDTHHLTLTTSAGVNTTPQRYFLVNNTSPRNSMYYLKLNANPVENRWHKVSATRFPYGFISAMTYDPDDDVLFSFGYDGGASTTNNWVYCPTVDTQTPGVLTAKQITAGCSAPDDWTLINPVGRVEPPGAAYPGMVYDTVTKKVIAFGGMNTSATTSYNQTWAYDIPTRTWARKAVASSPPPVYSGSWVAQPAMVYIPATNRIIYHQTSNSGAPADWEYNPVAETWTRLVSSGGGAQIDQYLAFDSHRNVLIGFNQDPVSGAAVVWQGVVSSTRVPFSPCDLDQDGVVTVLDIQRAVLQTLGTTSCTTADLNRDGVCNGVDIQRFTAAALGSTCLVGPN